MGLQASDVFKFISDILLPHHCELCQVPASQWLCEGCYGRLNDIASEAACGCCAAPLAVVDSPCPRCFSRPRRLIRRVARLGVHDDVLRDLVHRMKYCRRWQLCKPLADELRRQRFVEELLHDADMLVPVPLHWSRHYSRGYNQSQLLAQAVAQGRGIGMGNALRRLHHRGSQTTMGSVVARLKNVKDAFAITGGAGEIAGKRVVLVDDVMTTGATLRAAARALQEARPARVDAIVLAVADPKERGFKTIS